MAVIEMPLRLPSSLLKAPISGLSGRSMHSGGGEGGLTAAEEDDLQ
jgi:hypothetical protein